MIEERLLLIFLYLAIACLVLIFGFKSSYSLKFKISIIILTSLFYFSSWESYKKILGWPSQEELPDEFDIIWVVISETKEENNSDGQIFLWVKSTGSFNDSHNRPRSYQIQWNDKNLKTAQDALHQLKEGKRLNGRKTYGVLNKDNTGTESNPYDIQEGKEEQGRPSFEFFEVPPPELPLKTLIQDQ